MKDLKFSSNSWEKLNEYITVKMWEKISGPRSGKSFSIMSSIKDEIDINITKCENRAKLLMKAKKYRKAYKLLSKVKKLKEFKLVG